MLSIFHIYDINNIYVQNIDIDIFGKKKFGQFFKNGCFSICMFKIKKALYQNDVIKILLTVCAERWDGSKMVP